VKFGEDIYVEVEWHRDAARALRLSPPDVDVLC
jgi:hypothetical protein